MMVWWDVFFVCESNRPISKWVSSVIATKLTLLVGRSLVDLKILSQMGSTVCSNCSQPTRCALARSRGSSSPPRFQTTCQMWMAIRLQMDLTYSLLYWGARFEYRSWNEGVGRDRNQEVIRMHPSKSGGGSAGVPVTTLGLQPVLTPLGWQMSLKLNSQFEN